MKRLVYAALVTSALVVGGCASAPARTPGTYVSQSEPVYLITEAQADQIFGIDLSEGMLAVASGEGKLAQDKAAKAAKYLNQPHLTNLLAAQAAETSGDTGKAIGIYRTLLDDDRTRFVGIRGLMRQKLAEGDTHKALLLAQKAYALKPRHKEVQDTLLDLQTREQDWKGARQTLKDKRTQGDLPKDVALRRDAVLALQDDEEAVRAVVGEALAAVRVGHRGGRGDLVADVAHVSAVREHDLGRTLSNVAQVALVVVHDTKSSYAIHSSIGTR